MLTPHDAASRDPADFAASGWTRARLASLVDHTLLRPEATREAVADAVAEARELGVHSVCVSPSMLPVRADGLTVCTVVGFPSGKHHALVKAMEARLAVEQGATELDVVIDYSAILAGRPDEMLAELVPLRDAAPAPVRIKIIVETAALYDVLGESAADDALARACEVLARGGADWVKTSTGFHPAGGAGVRAVRVMREALPASVGVKAAGGITSARDAIALVEAGATRLGTSRTRQLLAELPE